MPQGPDPVRPRARGSSSTPDVEQSNSSVVVADRHLIKVFRLLLPRINPELDAQRLLRAGECPDVPRLEGAIHGPLGPHTATYAVVQQFVPDAEDGWAFALRCVKAALDGRPDEGLAELVELGAALARVHAVLSAHGEIGALTAAVRRRLAEEMAERLEQAVALAPELSLRRTAITELFAVLGSKRAWPGGLVQRVHGDLHLGQVLRAGSRWYVVDFEGEPAAPFDQRTALHPPERDLAGMLRSLDYAAKYAARSEDGTGPGDAGTAADWAARAARALRSGYRSVTGLGPDPLLLAAYQIDKAVYELCYEIRNRPDWAAIPRRGLERLLAASRNHADLAEREQLSVCVGR